jgi:hypothetical protein
MIKMQGVIVSLDKVSLRVVLACLLFYFLLLCVRFCWLWSTRLGSGGRAGGRKREGSLAVDVSFVFKLWSSVQCNAIESLHCCVYSCLVLEFLRKVLSEFVRESLKTIASLTVPAA